MLGIKKQTNERLVRMETVLSIFLHCALVEDLMDGCRQSTNRV